MASSPDHALLSPSDELQAGLRRFEDEEEAFDRLLRCVPGCREKNFIELMTPDRKLKAS